MEINQWIFAAAAFLGLLVSFVMPDASPAKIVVPPKDIKIIEDGAAIFYCFTTGNPTPEITWLKNGKVIASGKRRYSILNLKGGSLLRMSRVSAKKDVILITCDVGNGVGDGESASASVHIYKTGTEPDGFPIITTQPNFRVVETGRSTVLTCAAAGDPPPKVRWLKEWQPVDMDEQRFSLAPTGSLQIVRAKAIDGGKYECVAENNFGTDYSYSANLHVRDAGVRPAFVVIPQDQVVDAGGSLSLECEATGRPLPDVVWVKDNIQITQLEKSQKGKSALFLNNVTAAANYTCVAGSPLGMVSVTATVMIRQPGPDNIQKDDIDTIRGLFVKSISSSSVTLFWWPPIRPGVSSYMITWDKGDNPGFTGIPNNKTMDTIIVEPDPDQNNATMVEVPSLTENTLYTFTVTVLFNDGSTFFTTIESTTKTKAPTISGIPKVVSTEQRTICTIHLDLNQFVVQVQPKYSYHLLVVIPLEQPTVTPDEIQLENMTMAETPDSAYITAEFGVQLPRKFTLGDGKVYGNYVNRQLLPDKKYRIFLRVYTINPKTSETVHSSTGYSDVIHGDKCTLKTSTQPRQYCSRCSGTTLLSSGILMVLILLRAFCTGW